jgi:hypothetical protein
MRDPLGSISDRALERKCCLQLFVAASLPGEPLGHENVLSVLRHPKHFVLYEGGYYGMDVWFNDKDSLNAKTRQND